MNDNRDGHQEWHHHEQLMREQEIDRLIREAEKAREAVWQARDQKSVRHLWSVK